MVVKIIIDKENEITSSISNPYFKTTADFDFESNDEKVKLGSTLNIGNKLYQFESEDKGKQFLGSINKNTVFKVIGVENKKSIRK